MQLPVTAEATVPSGVNGILPGDMPVHSWYSFVLSFPPHLVREYLRRFDIGPTAMVLDPFSGTGTTPVECKKLGIPGCGIEAIPVVHFAGSTKVDWAIDHGELIGHAERVAATARERLSNDGLTDGGGTGPPHDCLLSLEPDQQRLLISDSISPLPLHRTLTLLEALRTHTDERFRRHELLALASVLPTAIGNLRFGPEVGVGAIRQDAPVVDIWLGEVRAMARDLDQVKETADTPCTIHHGDAREPMACLQPGSIDAVITSPPYPNEKDYSRVVRLESVLLGFMSDRGDLRATKEGLLRSNTRNCYKADEDDAWIAEHAEIQELARRIEERRIELGKDSGFERMYARATKLYFGGMARHFANLREALRPGAKLAYVVGDQASYLRVMIRTGQLLADIAESLGYRVLGIDLFRTRMATATRAQLREEVVLLEWPG